MPRRSYRAGRPAALASLLLSAALPEPSVCQSLILGASEGERILPAPYEDPERALRLLAELRRLHPDDASLHLAAARESTALGLVADSREEGIVRFQAAAEAARAAEALRTLELDSLHGGAHHIVGRLHTGAQRLSWVSRLIARRLGLGDIIQQASWESAERHLRMAARYDPDTLVHHVELAKLLLHRGRRAEGEAVLASVASRRPRHRVDERSIREARTLLAGALPAFGDLRANLPWTGVPPPPRPAPDFSRRAPRGAPQGGP